MTARPVPASIHAMPPEPRHDADARLDQAARDRGYADPRPALRDRLRELKESSPTAFRQARAHYEQVVLPALGSAADPLSAWVDYARFLGGLAAAGRMLAIEPDGRARGYDAPTPGLLLLYVPDDTAVPVLVAAAPASPTPAQQATLDLLVHRKLSM